jgi:hypothetical protein
MSDHRSLARINTGVEDAMLHNTNENPFEPPEGWATVNIYTMEWNHSERPPTSGDFGGSSIFTIYKTSDHVGPISLYLEVGALTVTGGTFKRFVDWLLPSAIKELRVSYYGTQIQKLNKDDIMELMFRTMGRKKFNAAARLAVGQVAAGARESRCTATQIVELLLPLFWTWDIRYWFPVVCLSGELTITIDWEPLASIVQTDGTAPVSTITKQELHFAHVHVSNKDRGQTLSKSLAGNGIIYKYVEPRRQVFRPSLASTVDGMQLEITQLRGATQSLYWYARKLSEVESTTFGNDFYNYQRIDYGTFSGLNFDVVSKTRHDEFLYRIWPSMHKGEPGVAIYEPPGPSMVPDDRINNSGSWNLAYMPNKLITLNYDTANTPTVAQRYDVVGLENNAIQLVSGDLTVLFK